MVFLDYLNIVIKHLKILILSIVICVILGIIACFIVPKVYEANGKLLISQDNMSIMGGSSPLEDIMLSSLGKSDPLTTQTEILKTRPILLKVIDTLQLKDKNGVVFYPEDFVKFFKFNVIRNTNLIDIHCKYKNADTSALFVNILLQVFVECNQQMNQEIIKTAKDFIKEQLVCQKLKVEEAEQNLIKFKEKAKTVSLEKEANVNIEAYSNLNVEFIKVQSDLDCAIEQQIAYKTKITTLHSESNPQYQLWIASNEQIENVIIGLTAKKEAIKKQLDIQKENMSGIPLTEAQLIGLLREQKIASEIYTSLLSKFEEYKVQEVAKIGSAKIIEPAISPLKPIIPKKKILLVFSFLLGISIGISIIFCIVYFKGLPHSIDEIKNSLGYSVLGVIPYDKSIETSFFTRDNSFSVQSEAIRIVQTSIKFKIQEIENKGTVILITSTQPGEGKSTIATNLAYSYSKSKKTILMGMDFRKPSFKRIFGESFKSIGISDSFDDMNVFYLNVQKFDELHVIGPGTLPSSPLDLVQSNRMSKLMDLLRLEFEVIIVDSAPITLVAETSELIKFADIISVVVDMTSVSLKNLQSVKEIFDSKNIMPGIIVNKYSISNDHYNNYSAYSEQNF